MNKNLLVGLVIAALAAVGFVIVSNNSKTQAPTQNTQDHSQTNEHSAMEEPSATSGNETMGEEEIEVTLTENGFQPKSITIGVGDKVVWENESGNNATVDSAQHPTHLTYPKLNLGGFQDGEELELVFDEPGTYSYHDHLNPERVGTVVVE